MDLGPFHLNQSVITDQDKQLPKENANIADEWLNLEEFYKPRDNEIYELNQFITESLNYRWNLISDNIHPASYLVDPRFRNNLIEHEDFRVEKN